MTLIEKKTPDTEATEPIQDIEIVKPPKRRRRDLKLLVMLALIGQLSPDELSSKLESIE